MKRSWLLVASCCVLLGVLCGGARAQGGVEARRVEIAAPARAGSGGTVTLTGDWSVPPGNGPFPAALLMHGCSGKGRNMARWREFLNAHGVAALALDSFAARGIREVCSDPTPLSIDDRVSDAHAALDWLAARPEVAPDKVLLMGFSHGGATALDTAGRLFRSDAARPRFRACVAFYPSCGHLPRMRADYGLPVLILIGEADDWTPAQPCRELAAAHSGQDMAIAVYPGAYHGFDNAQQPVAFRPEARNRNSPTGKGATVGGDPAAMEAARKDVLAYLKRLGVL